MQVVAFSPLGAALPPTTAVILHFASYGLLVWFVVLNRRRLGVLIAGLGMGLNLMAITANGGYMPASRAALDLAGNAYDGQALNNSAVIDAGTRLSYLGDVFAVPSWMPAANVFSLGDVLIVAGIAVILVVSMRDPPRGHRGLMSAVAAVREQLAGYHRVLVRRDYRLLWAAQLVSTFGDRLTQIGLTALVFAMTGSDLSIGLVLTLTVLPRAAFGLFAGALADRVSRKTVLIVTDCVRALIVLVLALAAGLPLQAVYLLTVLHATATVFFTPARNAVLPDIVPRRDLLAANTLDETTQGTLDPIAYLVGGAIIAGLGVRFGFGVDSITFLVSAALIMQTTTRGAAQWHAPRGDCPRRRAG